MSNAKPFGIFLLIFFCVRATVHYNRTVQSTKPVQLHFLRKEVSEFQKAASSVYGTILSQQDSLLSSRNNNFDLSKWDKKTKGGLSNEDRLYLAKVYGEAKSLFEFGLGESTYIADHVGVARYAGIDSDVNWVNNARKQVASHFRFYYGDIGDTLMWGVPANKRLAKSVWQYQVAPLEAELQPFDVYMVDGRWRVPLVFLSFLHASARGAKHDDTLVLLHDCYRPDKATTRPPIGLRRRRYNSIIDGVLELVGHSGSTLCAYKRKSSTTDAQLLKKYHRYMNRWG